MLKALKKWFNPRQRAANSLSEWQDVYRRDLDYLLANKTISQETYDTLLEEVNIEAAADETR